MVKTGPSDGQNIAILSGLSGNETVVTAGADGLEDGSKVRLPGDAPAGGQGRRKGGAAKGGRKHHGQSASQG